MDPSVVANYSSAFEPWKLFSDRDRAVAQSICDMLGYVTARIKHLLLAFAICITSSLHVMFWGV
jgi:hypothetical protein